MLRPTMMALYFLAFIASSIVLGFAIRQRSGIAVIFSIQSMATWIALLIISKYWWPFRSNETQFPRKAQEQ